MFCSLSPPAIFAVLLFLMVSPPKTSLDATRVYNAIARSPDGSHDMNIQVIQVGIINFDNNGRQITVTPPPITVHEEIKHRVTWSPETGFVTAARPAESEVNPPPPASPSEVLVALAGPTPPPEQPGVLLPVAEHLTSTPLENGEVAYRHTHHSRHRTSGTQTGPLGNDPVSSLGRKLVSNQLFFDDPVILTGTALILGLLFLIVFAYLLGVIVKQKRQSRRAARRREKISAAYAQRALPALPFEHDYENLSELGTNDDATSQPPPIPPRSSDRRRQHPIHRVLDQPIEWLLEQDSDEKLHPSWSAPAFLASPARRRSF